jgi:predicted metal-binding protein
MTMRSCPAPKLHLFVCANEREDVGLGPGCGARGEAVYVALKKLVAANGLVRDVWVTKTHCLGICPKHGATVARYGAEIAPAIKTEVTPTDVAELLRVGAGRSLLGTLDDLHDLQRKKVLDLARRLKPGLTLEDVQNPHDFPELDDPDWHYADGVLAGIASVRSALLAREEDHGQQEEEDA